MDVKLKKIMKNYPKAVKEFVTVRLEQTPNNTQIARDVKNKFDIVEQEQDVVRRWVSDFRKQLKIEAKKVPIKRLFFDIETGYHTVRLWRTGKVNWVNADQIIEHKKIICISYKWQYENTIHTLDWRMGEKDMLKAFIKVMGDAHEMVGHNGDRFDIKELRTRCINYGVLMFPHYRTLDTLKKTRQYFNFASNKLDYVGKYLNVGGKLAHDGFQLWIDVVENKSEKALLKMIEYCERDVILLEDVFFVISPYINHNNNFAVLTGGEKWDCPECASTDVKMFRTYSTPMGVIRREMKCNNCKKQYKISNKTYMRMLENVAHNG